MVFIFIAKIPSNPSLCLQSHDRKENAKDSEDDETSDVSEDNNAKKMHAAKKVVLHNRDHWFAILSVAYRRAEILI